MLPYESFRSKHLSRFSARAEQRPAPDIWPLLRGFTTARLADFCVARTGIRRLPLFVAFEALRDSKPKGSNANTKEDPSSVHAGKSIFQTNTDSEIKVSTE